MRHEERHGADAFVQLLKPYSFLMAGVWRSGGAAGVCWFLLLTELLVVEFCSQFGVGQVLLEDLIHLFALFSCEVVLPVTNLTCAHTHTINAPLSRS